jgi:glycosyltransferase involved in cell wall biosynthesis
VAGAALARAPRGPGPGHAGGGHGNGRTREILGGTEAGLLVTDPPALADAVARIAGDGALRDRLREAARARPKPFSPGALIPRYEAVYRRLA